jgi:hypothetical protein
MVSVGFLVFLVFSFFCSFFFCFVFFNFRFFSFSFSSVFKDVFLNSKRF